MNIDELLQEITMLKGQLELEVNEVLNYKKLYSDVLTENDKLRTELEETKKELKDTQEAAEIAAAALEEQVYSVPKTEEVTADVNRKIKLDGAYDYAAEVIGKIVVKAAEYSTLFTSKPSEYSVDLINLVLGKSEVGKSEILSIANSDNPFEKQCKMMDDVLFETENYFRSLSHQV